MTKTKPHTTILYTCHGTLVFFFNINESGLMEWKALSKKTLVSCTGKFAPGYKMFKECVTLLAGGNTIWYQQLNQV